MNTKDFSRLGIPLGEATRRATDLISKFILAGGDKMRLEEEVKAIIDNPSAFSEDSLRGQLAKALLKAPPPPRAEPIKYRQWGEGLEREAVMQMEKACLLPVAVAGALMPDAATVCPSAECWLLKCHHPVCRCCRDHSAGFPCPRTGKPFHPVCFLRRRLSVAVGRA